MDIINTERFTITDQKIVTVATSNGTSNTINLVGVVDNFVNAGIVSRLVTMWIPCSKRIDQSER